jgi:hypothetical protein
MFREAAKNGEDEDMDEDEDVSELIPTEIKMLYDNGEAMSAMGGMLWYLRGVRIFLFTPHTQLTESLDS